MEVVSTELSPAATNEPASTWEILPLLGVEVEVDSVLTLLGVEVEVLLGVEDEVLRGVEVKIDSVMYSISGRRSGSGESSAPAFIFRGANSVRMEKAS